MDSNTKLLMHMDDNTFKDECRNIITNNGATLDITNKKFGNGSSHFLNNSHLTINTTTSELDMGIGDFTIDFWMYYTGTQFTNATIYANNTSSLWQANIIEIHSNHSTQVNKISFWVYNSNPSSAILSSVTTLIGNTWYHVAIVRNNGTIHLYINGKDEVSAVYNYPINFAVPTSSIGSGAGGGTGYFSGYIDEFRISNIARWTSNFTPPTSAYISNKFLIKQNSQYYSIKPEFYSESNDIYNPQLITQIDNSGFDNYGIQDLSSIHNTALNKLIDNKYNIALLK